jgi:hypothetical protein
MAVKFVKPCQQGALYNEGEIAAFDKETEERLVKQEFAEPVKAEKAEKPAA